MDTKHHIERAVAMFGSQARLASAVGCSQQQISNILTGANAVTAEMAARIARATGGRVSGADLRPDIFLHTPSPVPPSSPGQGRGAKSEGAV